MVATALPCNISCGMFSRFKPQLALLMPSLLMGAWLLGAMLAMVDESVVTWENAGRGDDSRMKGPARRERTKCLPCTTM